MYKTPIYFAGCDRSGKGHFRAAAYLREMQKAACLDLSNFDLSPELLQEEGIAFVLSKTSLVIDKPTLPSAELELLTYPRATRGVSFMRDFVFSQNGETVARATTRWGILDLNARTLVRPDKLPCPIPGDTERFVGFEPPRLSPALPEDAVLCGTERVRTSMTDANGHFNNAAYLDLCLDLTEDKPLLEMHIEYKKELMQGDSVSLYRKETEEGSMLYGMKDADNTLSFLVLLRADQG